MDAEQTDTELVARKNATSVIWRYFVYKISDTEQRERYREITNCITHCLAGDMLPIYTVSKGGFQKVIRTLDKRYQLPSRNYFS
ncbi:E3 SUMO-protein ligase ZBED1-like [Tachysurus ichikawai]